MAVTGEALLEKTLFDHLETLTTTPSTTFAWPNVKHNGRPPYLEVQHLPNTARANRIEGGKDLPGFLVITVVTEEGEGTVDAKNIATQVVDHFEGEMLFTTDYRIRFIQPGSISQSLPDKRALRTPVSIPYIAND